MTIRLDEKHRAGIMANGSWMDITAFSTSFRLVIV
jgi:hypothetical protein